jgi:hypothetical protein
MAAQSVTLCLVNHIVIPLKSMGADVRRRAPREGNDDRCPYFHMLAQRQAGKSVQFHTVFLSGEIEPSAADSLRRPHGICVVIILNVAESVVVRSGRSGRMNHSKM